MTAQRSPANDAAASFERRHIGPSPRDVAAMLETVGAKSLNAPMAMGYLPISKAEVGTLVFTEVRGQRLALRVAAMPFVPNSYKR